MRKGFTLIELSIVLVIIALIVGGVLVGRDLIAATRLRATIAQNEKFNTAALTFKAKYGGLPGDLITEKAAQFGFLTRDGANYGNGNGFVEANPSRVNFDGDPLGESYCFWADLSQAQLIDFTFNPSLGAYCGAANYGSAAYKNDAFPSVKFGYDAQLVIFTDYAKNYFALTQINPAPALNWGNSIPPLIGYALDGKIDDGRPLSGIVQATTPLTTKLYVNAVPAAPAPGVCVSNASGNPYNVLNGADTAACGLRVATSF